MVLLSMLPKTIEDVNQLDDLMSKPSAALVEMMKRLDGDVMVLGIGGKMGHTLGRQVMRAIVAAGITRRIIGVSRFSDRHQRTLIEESGVETIQCDLLDPNQVAQLPDAKNIVFMAGRKFGTGGNEHLTWAMNTVVPAIVARRFHRSRIVVFSTGCVYPLVNPANGGCAETEPADPVGEYAVSCLGRERIFEHFSRTFGTPVSIIRLNYAIDMRYGVLHDIARSIIVSGSADISVPAFNAIWQGDATDQILRSLDHCNSPPFVLNVTGPEQLSTKTVALKLSRLLCREVTFKGPEGSAALLSDSAKARSLFGQPSVSSDTLIAWTADWVKNGGASLEKPTHFEVDNGKF